MVHRPSQVTMPLLPGAIVRDTKGRGGRVQSTVYTAQGPEERTDVKAVALKEGAQTQSNWMPGFHGGAPLASSLTISHEPGEPRVHFHNGHLRKVAYGMEHPAARNGRAAGIHPFKNAMPKIVKIPDPPEGPVTRAADQDFPDFEPISVEDPDEENMLSLEDPYPCRFGSGASLSMRTRECKGSARSRSEGSCCACFSPFHCLFWL